MMEQQLRGIIYQLIREVQPELEEKLTDELSVRLHFETREKKIAVCKEDGFISILAYRKLNEEWFEIWDFELMPVSNSWVLMGMKMDNPELYDVLCEEEELKNLLQFAREFEQSFYEQFV